MTRVVRLTSATRDGLPPCCTDCVFWQQRGPATDARAKERWAAQMDGRVGGWGRVLYEAGGFRGMVQYGPATAFARARVMPAGPPGHDAALITCVYMEGDDLPGTCERLLLEALADMKQRRVRAVEAFALHYPDEVPRGERFDTHHTLFDRDLLVRLGFTPVRTHGQVSLMRLPLGGLQPGMRERAAGLVARLRPPAPATAEPAMRGAE